MQMSQGPALALLLSYMGTAFTWWKRPRFQALPGGEGGIVGGILK